MQKKIPTLLGLILIVALIGGLSVVVNFTQNSPIKAFKTLEPRDIRVSNITSSSFTVTWVTNEPATGMVKLNENLFSSKICFDDRDIQGKIRNYYTHSTTCKQVKPSTQYVFQIISNGKTYSNKSGVYAVYTAPTVNQVLSGLEPAFGMVLNQDNSPSIGALIYVTLENGQTLSGLTNETGSWLIPINVVRSEDLTRYITLTGERLTEYVTVKNQVDEATAITDSLNDSPVPTMVIGKIYDFRKQQAKKPNLLADLMNNTTQPNLTPVIPSVLGTETTSDNENNNTGIITISQPQDNAVLTSTRPLFKGKALAGKPVTLTIGITDPQSVTLTTQSNGIWQHTPEKDLGNGKQTVTLTTTDVDNKPLAMTNTFTILKSGTQVLGTATPSATIAVTPRVTNTPIRTPTPTTAVVSNPPPETGNWLPTVMILVASFIFLTSGLVLYIR